MDRRPLSPTPGEMLRSVLGQFGLQATYNTIRDAMKARGYSAPAGSAVKKARIDVFGKRAAKARERERVKSRSGPKRKYKKRKAQATQHLAPEESVREFNRSLEAKFRQASEDGGIDMVLPVAGRSTVDQVTKNGDGTVKIAQFQTPLDRDLMKVRALAVHLGGLAKLMSLASALNAYQVPAAPAPEPAAGS